MSVSPINSAQSAASTSSKTLAANFDVFLKMLTTQLQYQDPTEPQDPSKFTEQLVQFASVEQQIATNKGMENLIAAYQATAETQVNLALASQAMGLVTYIGKDIEHVSDKLQLADGGTATFSYTVPDGARTPIIEIKDKNGVVVRRIETDPTKGDKEYVWDGKDNNGAAVAAGEYTVSVIAKDAQDKEVPLQTKVLSRIDGVKTENGEYVLTSKGQEILLEQILSVRAPAGGV